MGNTSQPLAAPHVTAQGLRMVSGLYVRRPACYYHTPVSSPEDVKAGATFERPPAPPPHSGARAKCIRPPLAAAVTKKRRLRRSGEISSRAHLIGRVCGGRRV